MADKENLHWKKKEKRKQSQNNKSYIQYTESKLQHATVNFALCGSESSTRHYNFQTIRKIICGWRADNQDSLWKPLKAKRIWESCWFCPMSATFFFFATWAATRRPLLSLPPIPICNHTKFQQNPVVKTSWLQLDRTSYRHTLSSYTSVRHSCRVSSDGGTYVKPTNASSGSSTLALTKWESADLPTEPADERNNVWEIRSAQTIATYAYRDSAQPTALHEKEKGKFFY